MKRLLAAFVLVMFATGCTGPEAGGAASGSPTEAPAAAPAATLSPVVMRPGKFTFRTATGATGTLSLPGTPDPEVEKLRALVGGEAPTYVSVTIDNLTGTESVGMHSVSVFTPENQELKYLNASTYVDGMRPSGAEAEVYNVFIKLSATLKAEAKPQTAKDFVLVGPPVPEGITGVKVYASGMADPVDATPAG